MQNPAAGNPALEKLHEISLPTPPAWMPQTAGWYVLFGIALLAAGYWGYRRFLKFRANRYRRIALAELSRIEHELKSSDRRYPVLLKLAELVKRTALSAFPRAEVAALSGESWLAFLDRTTGGRHFSDGPGRLLGELAYLPARRVEDLEEDSISALFLLSRRWIKDHKTVTNIP